MTKDRFDYQLYQEKARLYRDSVCKLLHQEYTYPEADKEQLADYVNALADLIIRLDHGQQKSSSTSHGRAMDVFAPISSIDHKLTELRRFAERKNDPEKLIGNISDLQARYSEFINLTRQQLVKQSSGTAPKNLTLAAITLGAGASFPQSSVARVVEVGAAAGAAALARTAAKDNKQLHGALTRPSTTGPSK